MQRLILKHLILSLSFWAASLAFAQDGKPAAPPNLPDVLADIEVASKELADQQRVIDAEKRPLTQELRQLEIEIETLRREFETELLLLQAVSERQSSEQAQNALLQSELAQTSMAMIDFLAGFEASIHPMEIQHHQETVAQTRDRLQEDPAPESLVAPLNLAIERLGAIRKRESLKTTAYDASGKPIAGESIPLGPSALFLASDRSIAGYEGIDSNNPHLPLIVPTPPTELDAVTAFFGNQQGTVSLIESNHGLTNRGTEKETWLSELKAGGVVMFPILLLAGGTLLIAFLKSVQLRHYQQIDTTLIDKLTTHVTAGQFQEASVSLESIGKRRLDTLQPVIKALSKSRELADELLFGNLIVLRNELERRLTFLSFTAAAAPLLGLLGTVTGMINTFKMIAVFGSGDSQLLAGGIQEALITTKYGLIVAVCALLFHTLLRRRARSILHEVERTGEALLTASLADGKG